MCDYLTFTVVLLILFLNYVSHLSIGYVWGELAKRAFLHVPL